MLLAGGMGANANPRCSAVDVCALLPQYSSQGPPQGFPLGAGEGRTQVLGAQLMRWAAGWGETVSRSSLLWEA